MFDASQPSDVSQRFAVVRMREAELRAAWRDVNGKLGTSPIHADRRPRLRSLVGTGFIRVGRAVTDLGRAVGGTEAA